MTRNIGEINNLRLNGKCKKKKKKKKKAKLKKKKEKRRTLPTL